MRAILLIFVFATAFTTAVKAQLEFNGEFKPRAQFNNGFRQLPDANSESALVFLQRTRLNLSYKYQDKFKLYASLQDARVWGDQDDRGDRANTGFFEMWGELYFNPKLSLKLGRQALTYDDGYLLANPGWVVNGRSYDAAILKFQDSTFSAHLGLAHNQDRIVLRSTPFENEIFKNLHLLWLNKTFGESRASFMFINRGIQRSDTVIKYTQTVGANVKLKKGNKFIQGIYYYQTGEDTLNRDVRAQMMSLKAGYQPNDKLEFVVGVDILSGTDGGDLNNPNFRETNNFDNLYGFRHKYYGLMDYFYRGFFPPSGLRDFMIKTKYKATDRFQTDLQLHSFYAQADVLNPENPSLEMDSRLGFEFDLVFGYRLNDITQVKLGYAQMFATETLEVVQQRGNSNETANFAYIEITVKPNFLKK